MRSREIRLVGRSRGAPVASDFELAEVASLVAEGTIRHRETVVDVIEKAPEAFIGMRGGANLGKMLVRVGPEP